MNRTPTHYAGHSLAPCAEGAHVWYFPLASVTCWCRTCGMRAVLVADGTTVAGTIVPAPEEPMM